MTQITPVVHQRSVGLAEHRQNYPSDPALAEAAAKKIRIGRETGRLVQADNGALLRQP